MSNRDTKRLSILLKSISCFRPIKRSNSKEFRISKINSKYKFNIEGTNIYLISYENKRTSYGPHVVKWKFIRARKDYFGNISYFYEIKPEEIFDDPDVPVELLFHLDILLSLNQNNK